MIEDFETHSYRSAARFPWRSKDPRSVRNGFIMAALILAIAIGIYFFFGHSSTDASKMRPSTTVGTQKVAHMDMPVTLNAIGTAQPVVNAVVRSQLAGILVSINFKEGQMVAKGTVLAQIDSRPYRLALQQAQGTLAKDTALLNAAKNDLNRYMALQKEDSISGQQVDTQRASLQQLQGTVQADKAAVGTAQLNLSYSSIKAPVSGRVGLRQADIGAYVSAGDANGIVTITVTSPMDVSFAIPQSQVQSVRESMAQHSIPVTINDQSNTKAIAQGQFYTFDNSIDATSGTLKAKARISNSGNALVPNQFVNVVMTLNTMKNAMTVPVTAVRTGTNGLFVYTLGTDNVAHRVAVTTGPSDGTHSVILTGLNGDETVIFEGADRIDEGSKVTTADSLRDGKPGNGTGSGTHKRHGG
jgi:membrane fusion protein, multidrug efflux system